MSDTTKIEWATRTFNPWIGCTKVSPGCAHCYAENTTRARVLRSHGHETWGKGKARSRTSAATWRNPVKWQRAQEDFDNPRPRIFPSLCDWLDDEVPIEWLADFLKLIHDTPNLDWLLLTKRPENFKDRLTDVCRHCEDNDSQEHGLLWVFALDWVTGDKIPSNIWLGVSVEDQSRADERIPELLKIPAAVRFLSVEPLLQSVDLNLCPACGNIGQNGHDCEVDNPCATVDWVIIGGESGPGARPCNIEWIRSIVRQCQAAGVPCFVKQLGSIAVADTGIPEAKTHWMRLKHPKGGDMAEWPEDLRIRQFPLSQEATHRATDGPH